LQPYVDGGQIDIIDCEATELDPVRAVSPLFARLDQGEIESLAVMLRPGQEVRFCTADKGAIRAAVMLGLVERAVSLEELLKQVGLSRDFSGRDDWQFSERRFQKAVRQANIDKVQGLGASPSGA
ncbi:MAG: hypothetical protein JSU73_01535, partial [candidate division WOR-3 bacterium]